MYNTAVPRKALTRPTDGELEILHVFWNRGERTVREVCDALGEATGDRPSSEAMLTRLEIMVKKGLARRDDSRSPKVFSAAVEQSRTQGALLKDFMKRVFGGSKANMLHALREQSATAQEVKELTKRLKQLRERR